MDFNITRSYVPINEKMESVQKVLSESLDNNTGTYKVGSIEVFSTVEIARLYTDISLPEDVVEAYDFLAKGGFDYCGKDEAEIDIKRYRRFLREQTEKLEKYQLSAFGVLNAMNALNSFDSQKEEIMDLVSEINKSDEIKNLKEIVDKLG